MKVVLVEDDMLTIKLIKHNLDKRRIKLDVFQDLNSIEKLKISLSNTNLLIFDINLNGVDYLHILSELISVYHGAICVLTTSKSKEHEINAFHLGVDLYIYKDRGLEVVEILLDKLLKGNYLKGTMKLKSTLSDKEILVFDMLLSEFGNVVPRDILFYELSGYEYDGESRSLDLIVSRLRKRIQLVGLSIKVVAVRGRGYKLIGKGSNDV